jgi:hypothetical protein
MKLISIGWGLLWAMGLSASTSLTIYNGGFAVVRDAVALELERGFSDVQYSGVTAQLIPTSVVLRDPSGVHVVRVMEQSYRGDPVDQVRLLQMFEGESIAFLRVVDGREFIEEGRIIRAPQRVSGRGGLLEPIIEVDGRLHTRLPGEPLFPSLGDDSTLLPTLVWKVHAEESASFEAQLSYLTRGLEWEADYNIILPESGDAMTLNGWVSIQNHTGKTFADTRIKLMAGDVNLTSPQEMHAQTDHFALTAARMAVPEVEERKFDDFRLYTLPLPTTLRDRETKQVEFARAEGVPTRRQLVYEGTGGLRFRGGVNTNENFGLNSGSTVAIFREFENRESEGLGIPLPAGRMRVYRMDSDGQLEFTGENRIGHTPRNETVRLFLGNAFDLVGERSRTEISTQAARRQMRETFQIEIRNGGESAESVRVVERLYRAPNWRILSSSLPFAQTDSQTIEFDLEVPADGGTRVTYTVEYNW